MRALAVATVAMFALTMVPAATADHLGPINDEALPGLPGVDPARPPGCVLTSSAAYVCASTVDGQPRLVRVSTFGPVAVSSQASTPNPGTPRVDVAAYSGSYRAHVDARLFDDSRDGLPDGALLAPSFSGELGVLRRAAIDISLRDRSGDGVPESPALSAPIGVGAPPWAPPLPNTPAPLPSLRPYYDSLGFGTAPFPSVPGLLDDTPDPDNPPSAP